VASCWGTRDPHAVLVRLFDCSRLEVVASITVERGGILAPLPGVCPQIESLRGLGLRLSWDRHPHPPRAGP
jgi:hypothetical protein